MSDRPKLGEAVRALLDALGIDGPGPEKRLTRAALAPVKVPETPECVTDGLARHYARPFADGWRNGYLAGYRTALRDIGVEVEE